MTNYEIMFIMNPASEESARTELIETVKEIINSDGEALETNDMGVKKLAYPIEKSNDGHYVVIEFKANPSLPKELDRRLRINEHVIRHMIINKDEK